MKKISQIPIEELRSLKTPKLELIPLELSIRRQNLIELFKLIVSAKNNYKRTVKSGVPRLKIDNSSKSPLLLKDEILQAVFGTFNKNYKNGIKDLILNYFGSKTYLELREFILKPDVFFRSNIFTNLIEDDQKIIYGAFGDLKLTEDDIPLPDSDF